ncbi:hypothetical protein BST61_g9256 [Cercospora zeina]
MRLGTRSSPRLLPPSRFSVRTLFDLRQILSLTGSLMIHGLSKLIRPITTIARRDNKMDALVQRSIKLVEDKKRSSISWKLDEPWHQPYYLHDGDRWTAREPKASNPSNASISKLALYSWNIDFMLPFPESRMKAALKYLEERLAQSNDTAVAIYLQECVESDLKTVSEQPWIQQNFCISDIDTSN